ncbi:MAG: CotH kinase family protein [Ignavibacteriales bacterium]|nr:CotH kinase family protein [Ignavibacteriales bacterium]
MKNFSLLLVLALAVGCEGIDSPELTKGSTLPRISLSIDYENFQILTNGVFSDRFVDGQLEHEDYRGWVNIRYQGRSTRNLTKKNYRIRFPEDRLFQQRRITLLTSQFRDATLMRSELSYRLFREAGSMVPKTEHVSLVLNGEYHGIYFAIEPIDRYFLLNRSKQIGNLYQAQIVIAHFTNADGVDIRLKFEKKLGDEGNYADLEYLLAVLDGSSTAELPQDLEPILDVNRYLEYMAVSALIANWDGFTNNLHLYHDPDQQRFVVIPWDMDLGMSVAGVDWNIQPANELNRRLLEIGEYRQLYKAKVQNYLDNLFTEQRVFAMIDSLQTVLQDAYAQDPFLLGYSLEQEVGQLKDFVRLRRIYLQNELANF